MRQLKEEHSVDILGVVCHMRIDRYVLFIAQVEVDKQSIYKECVFVDKQHKIPPLMFNKNISGLGFIKKNHKLRIYSDL